ncbi:DUF1997 domain-containing protein [filamentous cyanobacterium LEGE 11480]|uniref:DUF1997 domain-containing protein n=1 Tax=Romeriopsis navalis LEGE 11480 TaxID=2777977 RepID=A0A928VIS4_9CYAN|nr:DUF1997 domain-containing protein [Romeriopsis navalis]MBE9029383.1 DUF1997 domain-containing protein [Romeriopsis navalis LEGE 11480]
MDTCFQAKQSVELFIPNEAVPIQPYLRESERIVRAIGNSGTVMPLGGELFQLKLKPINFISLQLQPIVDMRVWTSNDDCLHIQSVACEILGLEQFNDPQFILNLVGELKPVTIRRSIRLQGHVHLSVQVNMPMPIALTPKPILEGTGNTIMGGVLSSMKQRLKKNLVKDYQDWVRTTADTSLVGAG